MNQRDIELLSSYLDGQLRSDVERARLESRLSADPDLRAVLDDLRTARGLLRKLPMRKAPRNFTLTPQMVGKNPPLPRSYPAFRFVTALASLMLFFTLGVNYLVPQMTAAPGPAFGMGGGGAPEVFSAQAPAATEAPALEEAPAAEPPAELVPLPTTTAAAADSARAEETLEKNAVTGESGPAADQSAAQNAASTPQEVPQPIPPAWQILLAVIAVLGALGMFFMRRLAVERWRGK